MCTFVCQYLCQTAVSSSPQFSFLYSCPGTWKTSASLCKEMVCAIQNVVDCPGVDAEVSKDSLSCVQDRGMWIFLPSPCCCTAHRWPFGFVSAGILPHTGVAALALLMETEH